MADRSGTPWGRFPAQAQPGDQVSKNFELYELTRSELAQRLRIDNSFAATGELISYGYRERRYDQTRIGILLAQEESGGEDTLHWGTVNCGHVR